MVLPGPELKAVDSPVYSTGVIQAKGSATARLASAPPQAPAPLFSLVVRVARLHRTNRSRRLVTVVVELLPYGGSVS